MKFVDNSILDSALNIVKNSITQICVCSIQPTSFIDATSNYKLAIKTGLTSGSFAGPVDGDVSGRKITVAQQAAIPIDVSGNATHIALCSNDTLLYVTMCAPQAVVAGNTITIPAWDIEIGDPI
jgi:hypothetical protein